MHKDNIYLGAHDTFLE